MKKETWLVKLWDCKFQPCKNLKHASSLVRAFIDENNLASSDWCNKSNGNVYDHNGKTIARVSYNGKIWDMEGKQITISL